VQIIINCIYYNKLVQKSKVKLPTSKITIIADIMKFSNVCSVSNGSRLPGRFPGWNLNRGPGSVLEPPWNRTTRWQVVPNPNRTYNRCLLAGFHIQQSLILTKSEFWLQLIICVLIVSQYDIYISDAVLHALVPPALQFAMRAIFVESLSNNAESWAFFAVTQRILIEIHIGEQEVKEHAKLHRWLTYHIVIQLELKYLAGAKVLSSQNHGIGQNTTGSVWFSFSMW